MTDDTEDWGPWMKHDGIGFPGPAGALFEVQINRGDIWRGVSFGKYNEHGSAWDWSSVDDEFWWKIVIRYRIHQPRALLMLRRIAALPDKVENLPAPERERLDT